MSKLYFKLIAAIVVLSILITPVMTLAKTTQQSLEDTDRILSAAITRATFIRAENIEAFERTFVSEYAGLDTALSRARQSFDSAAQDAKDATFKDYANRLSAASQTMSSGLHAMKSAYDARQDDALLSAAETFDAGYENYQKAATDYNNYLQAHPEKSGDTLLRVYLGLLIASIVLSIGTLIFWLRNGTATANNNVSQKLREMRQQIFLVSLLPVGGSLVTYFWYRYTITHSGGSYYVFYGPMIFGFIVFVRQAASYRSTVKRLQSQPVNSPVMNSTINKERP